MCFECAQPVDEAVRQAWSLPCWRLPRLRPAGVDHDRGAHLQVALDCRRLHACRVGTLCVHRGMQETSKIRGEPLTLGTPPLALCEAYDRPDRRTAAEER